MKLHIRPLLLSLLSCACFVAVISLHAGCANTQAAPAGGPKDTLGPILLATNPAVYATNVSTTLKRVELVFNEYVKLVDATKHVLLSPPPEKNPTTRTKGKGVVVDLLRDLDSNTTYTLYFGTAIQDNNEGNLFPSFALSFSTSDVVDSLMYSGVVVDAATLLPIDNATVVAHLNPVDTTLATCRPIAAARTDVYGYFTLRNLKDTLYSLYVIEDENTNFKYDASASEKVGFMDSLVRPSKVMFSYAPEIQPYFSDDTLGLLRRPIETSLYTFKEQGSRQYLREKVRFQERAFVLKFGAPFPQIEKLVVEGIDSTQVVRQDNFYQDSLVYWITAPKVPDTLHLFLSYQKTDDSLKVLVPVTDTIRLDPWKDPKTEQKDGAGNAPEPQTRQGGRNRNRNAGPPKVEERKAMTFSVTATPEVVAHEGISVLFNSLPTETDFSKATLMHLSASKDTVMDKFSIERDTVNLCLFRIFPENPLEGFEYEFFIPTDVLSDINGLKNDSLMTKYTIPKPDDLCELALTFSGVEHPLIVDLMNENRSQVQRTYWIKKDTTVRFSYLKAGKYALRLTEDANQNHQWDTGSLAEKRQAEKVRVFRFSNGKDVIDLQEKMELSQTIFVPQLLNENVKLTVPSKK